MNELVQMPVEMRFVDGVRAIPAHVAALLAAHKIPTETLTYRQAVDRMNWSNARSHLNGVYDRIVSEHLRDMR